MKILGEQQETPEILTFFALLFPLSMLFSCLLYSSGLPSRPWKVDFYSSAVFLFALPFAHAVFCWYAFVFKKTIFHCLNAVFWELLRALTLIFFDKARICADFSRFLLSFLQILPQKTRKQSEKACFSCFLPLFSFFSRYLGTLLLFWGVFVFWLFSFATAVRFLLSFLRLPRFFCSAPLVFFSLLDCFFATAILIETEKTEILHWIMMNYRFFVFSVFCSGYFYINFCDFCKKRV